MSKPTTAYPKRINVPVTAQQWADFRLYCFHRGLEMSVVIRAFIAKTVTKKDGAK